MPDDVHTRGSVFNDVAEQYERHRPGYPDELIDRACENQAMERRLGRPIRSSTVACLVTARRQTVA